MPQPLPPTLGEIRVEVATRSGLMGVNDTNARHKSLVDSFIRRAHREIFLANPWARLRKTVTFASVDQQTDYDIPDATYVGGIICLEALDTKGVHRPLVYDDSRDLSIYELSNATQPQWWRVIDDVIRVLPKVDAANFPSFYMEYEAAPVNLVNDADRAVTDGEAVIQKATIYLKRHLGTFADLKTEEMEHADYLKHARNFTLPGRMYGTASRDWQGPIYVRLNSYPTGAGTGPYTPTWNPWA